MVDYLIEHYFIVEVSWENLYDYFEIPAKKSSINHQCRHCSKFCDVMLLVNHVEVCSEKKTKVCVTLVIEKLLNIII